MPRPPFIIALAIAAVTVPLLLYLELIPEWVMIGSGAPSHSSAPGPCGEAYAHLESDPGKALSLIEECIATYGDDVPIDLHFRRAYLFIDQLPMEQVIADYTICIQKEYKLASSYNNRASAYYKTNRFDLAEKDARESVRHSPNHPLHLWNLGMLLNKNEKYREALGYLDKSIEQDADNAAVHYEKCEAYIGLNDFSKARASVDKAISITPERAHYYNKRAWLNMKMEMHASAIRDYKQALQLDPDSAYAHRGLAYSYQALGKAALSKKHRQIAEAME